MALNFPSSPALNDPFPPPPAAPRWIWNGSAWVSAPAPPMAYLPTTGGTLANPGNLTVDGITTLNNNAAIDGDLSVTGSVTTDHLTTTGTSLDIAGGAHIAGNVYLATGAGDEVMIGNDETAAPATGGNLHVFGDAEINNDLKVEGEAQIDGALNIDGELTVEHEPVATEANAMMKGTPGTYVQGTDFTDFQTFLDEQINNHWFDAALDITLDTDNLNPIWIANIHYSVRAIITINTTAQIASVFNVNAVTGTSLTINANTARLYNSAVIATADVRLNGQTTVGTTAVNAFGRLNSGDSAMVTDITFDNLRIDYDGMAVFGTNNPTLTFTALNVAGLLNIIPTMTNLTFPANITGNGQIIDNRPGRPLETYIRYGVRAGDGTTDTGPTDGYCYKHLARLLDTPVPGTQAIIQVTNTYGGTETTVLLTLHVKNTRGGSGGRWRDGCGFGCCATQMEAVWTVNADESVDVWLRRGFTGTNEIYATYVTWNTITGVVTGPDPTIAKPVSDGSDDYLINLFASQAPATIAEVAFNAPTFPTTPNVATDVVLGTNWTGPATPAVNSTFTHAPGSTQALAYEGDFYRDGGVFYQMNFTVSRAGGGLVSNYHNLFQIILRNGAENTTGQDPVASSFVESSTVMFRPTGNYTHLCIVPNTAFDGTFVLNRVVRFTGSRGAFSYNSPTLTLKDFQIRLRAGTSVYAGNGGLMATGASNTSFGFNACHRMTNAANNTAVGNNALARASSGGNNTAVGTNALANDHTGTSNTAVGSSALLMMTTGGFNTAVGFNCMNTTTAGIGNTAVGYQALTGMGGGTNNTVVGVSACQHLGNPSSENCVLGADAMRYRGTGTVAITTAQKSIFIGSFARGDGADSVCNNQIVIGADAVGGGSNSVTLGSSLSTVSYRCQVAWTVGISDVRGKQDIERADLDRCLDAVKQLPVSRWKWRDFLARPNQHEIGWTADDVEKVFPKSITVTDEQYADQVIENCKHHNAHHEALPMLWGAVQKLIERIEELERRHG